MPPLTAITGFNDRDREEMGKLKGSVSQILTAIRVQEQRLRTVESTKVPRSELKEELKETEERFKDSLKETEQRVTDEVQCVCVEMRDGFRDIKQLISTHAEAEAKVTETQNIRISNQEEFAKDLQRSKRILLGLLALASTLGVAFTKAIEPLWNYITGKH